MIYDFLEMYMQIFYFVVIPLIVIAAAVLGIVIFTGKAKSVKYLGLSIFLAALGQLISKIMQILNMISAEKAAGYTALSNIAGIVLGLGSTLCLCIFIHKNYGRKYIYALLLGCNVVTRILGAFPPVLFADFLADAGLKSNEYVYWLEMLSGISSFLIGSINTIIIIVVLIQNRKNEKVIPFYWLLRVLAFVWSIIAVALDSLSWLSLILAEDAELIEAQRFRDMVQVSTGFFAALIALAVPVYILIASKRALRKENAHG